MRPALRLSDAAARRDDNILPLRHIAALMVLYGHAYALSNNPTRDADLVAHALPGFYAGNLAVHIFFAVSGYLVTLSLLLRPGVLRYVRNRVLRVYPAYLMCLLLCVFALGPTFTTLPINDYFAAAGTWEHLRHNLVPVSFVWSLPGVFATNPVPDVVNGTLWSLGLEVRWYFYLGVLAALGLVRRRWAFTLIAVAVLALGMWEWWNGKPDPLEYRALSQTFLGGALLAQWREHVRVTHIGVIACILFAAFVHGDALFGAAVMLCVLHGMLWFAYRLPSLRWPRGVDVSYGLFLYGYPVQQMLMATFPTLSPLALCATSIAATLPFAAASWWWIEQPALRWKRETKPAVSAVEPAP